MAMVKVEHGSGIASIENSLENTAYENTEIDKEQKATHWESAPDRKRIHKNVFEFLKTWQ